MRNGFSALLLIVLVALLAGLPLLYWGFSNKVNLSKSMDNVRGVISTGSYASSGFSILVVSDSETWDLVEYLCKDLQACVSSLNSGERLGTVSGGQTNMHEVIFEPKDGWKDYKYIKVFVRPGWLGSSSSFMVKDLGRAPGSDVYTVKEGQSSYEFVVIPLEGVFSNFYKAATFSDR